MMRWLLSLLALLIIFAPSSASAQEDQSEAPYLYYYSDDLNAFIIERANGTDTRILGDGLMPENTTDAIGPGWSPSGEWFAWLSTRYDRYQYYGHRPYAVNVDSGQRLTLLDRFAHAHMVWAPDADYLFVTGAERALIVDETTGEKWINIVIALIEPSTETVIASVEAQYPYLLSDEEEIHVGLPSIAWTTDGQHAIAYYRFDETESFRVFDLYGEVVEKVAREPDAVFVDLWPGGLYPASPTGNVIYYSESDQQLIVESLTTGELQSFDFQSTDCVHIDWDSSGHHGLLATESCTSSDCDTSLWLIVLEESRLELVHPDFNAGWPNYMSRWSPDGQHAVFSSLDQILHHINVRTMEVIEVPDIRYSLYGGSDWYPDSHLMVTGTYDVETSFLNVYIYNVDSGATHRFEISARYRQADTYLVPGLSASERYLALVLEGVVIYDTVANTSTTLAPHRGSYLSFDGGEVIWHEKEDWLIIQEEALVAGGGGVYWMGVANAQGTIHRDLSFCRMWEICADWLPSTVDPSQLPLAPTSQKPTPLMILEDSAWIEHLSWSPDGQQLVSAWTEREEAQAMAWNLQTAAPIQPLEGWMEQCAIEWELDADGGYVPSIVDREPLHAEDYNQVRAVSPDGNQVVTEAGVVDATTGEMLYTDDLFRSMPALPVADFSSDGRLLAVPDPFGDTRIFETDTWEVLATLDTPSLGVRPLRRGRRA